MILSANRFVEAVFATLRLKQSQVLLDDGQNLDRAFHNCAVAMAKYLAEHRPNVILSFSFSLNQLHGDSPEFREALLMAGKSGLVSIDNPVFRTVRLKISDSRAKRVLAEFPIPQSVIDNAVSAEFPIVNGSLDAAHHR